MSPGDTVAQQNPCQRNVILFPQAEENGSTWFLCTRGDFLQTHSGANCQTALP